MAAIHISEADAIANIAGLLSKVREGLEVVIESGGERVTMRSTHPRIRTISEAIVSSDAHAKASSIEPCMDEAFANDLEEIIENRKPRSYSAWD